MKLKKYKKRTMNKNIPKTSSVADQEDSNLDTMITISEESDDQPVIVSTTSLQSTEKGEKSIPEVIDLDNYDATGKKKRTRAVSNKCVNFDCESGENLKAATIFCLNYYRVKCKPNKVQEICAVCYEKSLQYYEKLSSCLKSGGRLIDQEIPVHDEYVEIDSDEDEQLEACASAIQTCQIADDCVRGLEASMPEALNDALNEWNVEAQVDYAHQRLFQRQEKIATDLDELTKVERDIQQRIDKVRSDLYSQFQRKSQEVAAVEYTLLMPGVPTSPPRARLVTTTAAPFPAKPTSPPKREAERRSHRNITKPASYCELMDDVDPPGPDIIGEAEVTHEVAPRDQAGPSSLIEESLPPRGILIRTKPCVGETYYAQRQSVFGAWGRVRLLEIENQLYKVKFDGKIKGQSAIKAVTGRQLAYACPAPVRLEVGTRCIAVFNDEHSVKKESFYAGMVAEPLSQSNHWRYLIFFEDGYAQYVHHDKVLVICECSSKVWEDIHPDSQMFIRNYLDSFPERPMVKLQSQQVVKTEWNGKWWIARVVKVDCSLVHMYFEADSRSEWIYRGSTRLGPLFLETQAAAARRDKGPHIPKLQQQFKSRGPAPYVEYPKPENMSSGPAPPRAVAKKSTNRPPNTLPISTNMVPFLPTHQVQQPQSKVVYFTPKSVIPPKPFLAHECSPECSKYVTLPFSALRGYNPLSKPLLVGFHRQMFRYKGKRAIRYRAPCGRTLRSMAELHAYLMTIRSDISVDNFDFDYWVHCLAEFVLDKTYRSKKDISDGVEYVPIPCVNYVDGSMPDFTNYSIRREPMEGVNLNLNENFLCGCDCTDDCADRTKCACWQLTIREARTLNKRVPDDLIGYQYKRLPDCVTTGIYECNSRCKCAQTCLNRVVQHPLQLKLQLFKTANRGWGIRCLNDIPHGAFICIYAGNLLTDKMANEGGVNYGDEYLAELDYIEVVERQKDGYESDVTDIEDEEGSPRSQTMIKEELDEDDDEDYDIEKDITDTVYKSSAKVTTEIAVTTRSRIRHAQEEKQQECDETVTISDDEEIVREKSSFAPSSETEDQVPPSKFKSVRKMFGEDEVCYIMDAKNTGNIGRFLNHSCSPNVFVQNVFVDTHDLRFPWVAFFAMNYIRAGTELTWNYNYDVGSVPGKVIFCHCGSPDCRGRLL